jgi:hypothetical protein
MAASKLGASPHQVSDTSWLRLRMRIGETSSFQILLGTKIIEPTFSVFKKTFSILP